MKEKGVLITNEKYYGDRNLIQYYDGLFQNEFRNGKGIYYSSRGTKGDIDSNIYEGLWKNNMKNGTFVVYSGLGGPFPLSDNGVIFKSQYSDSKKITYVEDRDKQEIAVSYTHLTLPTIYSV